MTDSVITLDDEQERVATADVSERLYVVAGPGSGKTETVTARLRHLVEEEGLRGDALFVISFSRAAVEAVQRRLRSAGVSGGVWITTLDSFASRLLADCGTDLEHLSFDTRITETRRALVDGALTEALADIEHLIVDEVQDVVGVRADLLATMLGRLPDSAGFTLLGDPCQGIYDFQETADSLDAEALQHIAGRLGAHVVVLEGQYRALSNDTKAAMKARPTGTPAEWSLELDRLLSSRAVPIPADQIIEWLGRTDGTIAILTQSNAQALVVARMLWRAGVPADIQVAPVERPIDPWIARVLGGSRRPIQFDEFEKLASAADSDVCQERWLALKRLTAARGKSVSPVDVARRLASGFVPTSLNTQRSRVIVSTVHRAKGLEFDRVLLLNPASWYAEDGDEEALARAKYVAITRPRFRLFRFDPLADGRGWSMDRKSGRAIKAGFRHKGLSGFEVRGRDCVTGEPPDLDGDPQQVQALLASLGPGMAPRPVEVRLDAYHSTQDVPRFAAYLDGTSIGELSLNFSQGFRRVAGHSGKFPTMDDVFLLGTQTVAGLPQEGPVGENGLWLAPVIAGPAHLDWKH